MSANVVTGPTDFSGTNTEKIDKLVTTVIELRATLRFCYYIMGVGLPLVILLVTFLETEVFRTSGKIDRLTDHITSLERQVDGMQTRLERLERGKQ